MERAEALAQVLGQPYVHLGMNMPATAFTDGAPGGANPEDVIIWFGIIDILQVCYISSRSARGKRRSATAGGTLLTVRADDRVACCRRNTMSPRGSNISSRRLCTMATPYLRFRRRLIRGGFKHS